jgi:UDP-N-acetylmuramate dehydrogenase
MTEQSAPSQDSSQEKKETDPSFADLTTIGVGGHIEYFLQPSTRDGLIGAVMDADDHHLPLCVIGGGSNILASDDDFNGVVVRDARRTVTIETENGANDAEVEKGARDSSHAVRSVIVRADAGVKWDQFVALMVSRGYSGVEGLSGIPGTVGASVVQNIGAYGQEVSSSVRSVEVWDRAAMKVQTLHPAHMNFGYRTSALKESMYSAPGIPSSDFFPTPQLVVLSVTFALRKATSGTIAYDQLARALGAQVGQSMDISKIRRAVLAVRARKGMLEDPTRYANPWMAPVLGKLDVQGVQKSTRKYSGAVVRTSDQDGQSSQADSDGTPIDPQIISEGIPSQEAIAGSADRDRWSCGSFFMNPILETSQAAKLPEDAPRFDVRMPHTTGANAREAVKTSAAWLIDHAGFHKGYALTDDTKTHGRGRSANRTSGRTSRQSTVRQSSARQTAHTPHASLSTLHTLALTNRGNATASDIADLARRVQQGVSDSFGIKLIPEPVTIGINLA